MIIVQSPYRVSFFGGGTDYEPWFAEHGGCFLSLTIKQYITITLRPQLEFFAREFHVYWRLAENVKNLSEIQHPIVRELAIKLQIAKGFDLAYMGDLPSQSGMGSSSSFAVACILAFHKMQGLEISPLEAANLAYHIEKDVLGETVGIQDHIAAAFGGFNFVEIQQNGKYRLQKIIMEKPMMNEFLSRCLLVYTGIERHATKMAEKKVAAISAKKQNFHEIQRMAYEAYNLLESRNFEDFGKLLHETWLMKRALSTEISNDIIDKIYDIGRKNGAIGGKLLGAGGGGFVLLVNHDNDLTGLKHALRDYNTLPLTYTERGAHHIL